MSKLYFAFILLSLLFVSCEEEDRTFPEFGDDDVQTGAYARLTDGVNGIFDFFNPAESEIDFTVEFYDVNEGRDVASYSWTASYINNETEETVGPVPVLDIPSSEFTINDFGLPSTTVRFNLQETLDALDVPTDSLNGGDQIRYEATITLNDGRTFTRLNTGANVIGGASFRGTFIIDQAIICPSDLEGTFTVTTTTPAVWPADTECNPNEWTGEVTWMETSEGVYTVSDFSYGAYHACYGGVGSGIPDSPSFPGGSLQVQDACNILTPIGASQFGELYTFNSVTVEGDSLTIDWENDYGESGVSVLVRTDDKQWGPLRTN